MRQAGVEIVRSLLTNARAETHKKVGHNEYKIVHDTLLLVKYQFSCRSNVTIEPVIMAEIPLLFFYDRNKITQIIEKRELSIKE